MPHIKGAGVMPLESKSSGTSAHSRIRSPQNPYSHRYKHVGNASTVVSSLKNCKFPGHPPPAHSFAPFLTHSLAARTAEHSLPYAWSGACDRARPRAALRIHAEAINPAPNHCI